MKRLGGFLPDLRAGERRLAVLMSANYFLLLLFYYLLKPARDSLFLVEISPAQLPLAYVLTALVAAPVTAAYARAGLKHRLDRLIALTTIVLMVNLVVLRWLIGVRQEWVFYLFYSWVGVAGGLTTSQFWLLANGVFDAAQAKRIFPLLGLGGIAGAFVGGEFTSFLISNLGLPTRDLILVSVLVLAAAGLFHRRIEAVAFDEEFAEVAGLRVAAVLHGLLALVALTVVTLIRIVGVILVIALLTIPAATARQWSDDLRRMMPLAVLLGALCTTGGLYLSYWLSRGFSIEVPTGPLIILLAAALFGGSSLLRGRTRIGL